MWICISGPKALHPPQSLSAVQGVAPSRGDVLYSVTGRLAVLQPFGAAVLQRRSHAVEWEMANDKCSMRNVKCQSSNAKRENPNDK
jgi:hypothetical protein